MRKFIFAVALLAAAAPAIGETAPEFVTARAVAWDENWKLTDDKEWAARVVFEIEAAAKAGAEIVVFPEGFSRDRNVESVLEGAKGAAGKERLVIFAGAPHRDGKDWVSRTRFLSGGSWQWMDKLDLTPAERARKPPLKPGMRLPLLRFRGAVVAALPAYSLLKPEIAASLKKRGVSLVLVSAPADDELGRTRLLRAAAGRAVELGAAVLIAPPASEPPSLHLPAQKGFDLKAPAPSGPDFRVPWKKLLELRSKPDPAEPRPFLDPSPYFQVEI